MNVLTIESPVGPLTLGEADGALVSLRFGGLAGAAGGTPLLLRAAAALERYFAGEPVGFDLPLAPAGTAFQQDVWRALRAIPYGETRSYAELARAAGHGGACRAAGAAAGKNPLPILIPCHRLIRSDGTLGGYAGGAERKAFLWRLEHGQG